MQIMEMLSQTGGIDSMARELGIPREQAQSGAAALLPAILGGFKKQAQSGVSTGGGLGDLLGQLGGGGLLDDVLSPQPTHVSRGNDVLGQIFGSKEVSRTVAGNASSQTGLDPALLKKMLPILAMLVTGFLAKQSGTGTQGGGGILGSILGGLTGRGGAAPAGGGGLGSMLDMDGDGNPLDDILSMARKGLGG